MNAASAVEAVRKSNIPIILFHGEEDHFVPCQMSRMIQENAPKATLQTFPGAGHGLSYLTDPDRYEGICEQFLKDIF